MDSHNIQTDVVGQDTLNYSVSTDEFIDKDEFHIAFDEKSEKVNEDY